MRIRRNNFRGGLGPGRKVGASRGPQVAFLLLDEAPNRPAMSRVWDSTCEPALHGFGVDSGGIGQGGDVLAGVCHGRSESLVRHRVLVPVMGSLGRFER